MLLASWLIGIVTAAGCNADTASRPRQRYWTMPPPARAGSGGGASSAGGADVGGASGVNGGGTFEPVGGSESGSGGTAIGGEGGGAIEMPSFDAGIEPDRNAALPGQLCDRFATIQCAGEASCCPNPGRDFAACKDALLSACSADLLFDQIAMQPSAAFDAGRARVVLDELERLASQCDPAIAEYGESQEGVRSMFLGTIDPGGNCRPVNPLSNAMAGAALASCKMSASEACLPTAVAWTCTPRGGAGTSCFTDINCMPGFWCPNPNLDLSGASCEPRKAPGASCTNGNECQSLFCVKGSCVPPSKEAAYCPE